MRYFVLDSFTSRRNLWCILYITFSFLYLFYFMRMFACIAHICSTCVSGGCGGQKRVSDLLELELQVFKPPCGCWELDPGPLQEQ